jgi:hypothetical protein
VEDAGENSGEELDENSSDLSNRATIDSRLNAETVGDTRHSSEMPLPDARGGDAPVEHQEKRGLAHRSEPHLERPLPVMPVMPSSLDRDKFSKPFSKSEHQTRGSIVQKNQDLWDLYSEARKIKPKTPLPHRQTAANAYTASPLLPALDKGRPTTTAKIHDDFNRRATGFSGSSRLASKGQRTMDSNNRRNIPRQLVEKPVQGGPLSWMKSRLTGENLTGRHDREPRYKSARGDIPRDDFKITKVADRDESGSIQDHNATSNIGSVTELAVKVTLEELFRGTYKVVNASSSPVNLGAKTSRIRIPIAPGSKTDVTTVLTGSGPYGSCEVRCKLKQVCDNHCAS